MNKPLPYTPFSTRLSRSAKETEIRLRNIFSGPKKRPPVLFLVLMFSVCIFCGNLVSCQVRDKDSTSSSAPPSGSVDQDQGQYLNAMIAAFERDYDPYRPFYLPEEAPDAPQEGSRRLDSVNPAGESTLDGQRYGLYEVWRSNYYTKNGVTQWRQEEHPATLLFLLDSDSSPALVKDCIDFSTEGRDTDEIIRQAVWNLYDLEICLFQDGASAPVGPPCSLKNSCLGSLIQDETQQADGEPVYQPGDYWSEIAGDGFSALTYYSALDNTDVLYRLETTRTDLSTPRGIRVGSTREEVLAAYPDISDEQNWTWAYPDDYLHYSSDENGLGPNLYFFFEDNVVYMIQIVNLFN